MSRTSIPLQAARDFEARWASSAYPSRIVWPNGDVPRDMTAAETHWLRWNWFEGQPVLVERSTDAGTHVVHTLILEIYVQLGRGDSLSRRVAREAQEILDAVSPEGRLRFGSGEYRPVGADGAWWHSNLIVPARYEGASL